MYIFTNQLSCDLHMYLSIYSQGFLSNHLSVYKHNLLKKQNNSFSTQSNPSVMQPVIGLMNYKIKVM